MDVSKRAYSCGSARTTIDESANAIATSDATSAVRARLLRAALFCDCVEPFAEIIDVTREIIQPRQLRQRLESENPLEHRGRAVLDGPADTVVAARLGDQPALDQSGHGRIGRDAADPRDLRPRHRPEVRHDRERLQRRLRQAALYRPLEQPSA